MRDSTALARGEFNNVYGAYRDRCGLNSKGYMPSPILKGGLSRKEITAMHSGVCGVPTLPRKKLDQGWYNEPVFSEYYIYGRALEDVELPIEIG